MVKLSFCSLALPEDNVYFGIKFGVLCALVILMVVCLGVWFPVSRNYDGGETIKNYFV